MLTFTQVANGDSIASEGKGDYMFVEGRVLDLKGNPIAGAIIDTWETDGFGSYDTQASLRSVDSSIPVKSSSLVP